MSAGARVCERDTHAAQSRKKGKYVHTYTDTPDKEENLARLQTEKKKGRRILTPDKQRQREFIHYRDIQDKEDN